MNTFLIIALLVFAAPTADSNSPTAILTYSISDSHGENIPGRLTFTDNDMTRKELFPNPNADPLKLAVRSHAVYSLDGHGEITVPIGKWNILASHGIEWSIDSTTIDFQEGKKYSWNAMLSHEIDTTNWVSGDFHLHTLTHSGHGDSNMNERIISIVGEGLEFAVATDHNHNTDYQPIIDSLQANEYLTAVVGNEVSANYGHLNAFPLDSNATVLNERLDAHELFADIRNEQNDFDTVPIIQINHPRWGSIDYFGHRNLDPITGESEHPHWSWDFDSIEVLNENPGWGFHDAEISGFPPQRKAIEVRQSEFSVLQDWYNMLNSGRKIAAVGNSDSHTVIKNIAGIPRNYVYVGSDDPSNINPAIVATAIRDGQLSTTTGPFLTMTANGSPMGATVSLDGIYKAGAFVELEINAQTASWIDLDTITIVQNGSKVETIEVNCERTPDSPLKISYQIPINIQRDCWLIAIAEGDEPMIPYVMHSDRPVTPLAILNPIFIDADGDGEWTSPWDQMQEAVADVIENYKDDEGDRSKKHLNKLFPLFDKLNPSEQALLVRASGRYPTISNEFFRLGLSSTDRIVKLAACKAAQESKDRDLINLLTATIDNPSSDRFLAYCAWAALDTIDSNIGADTLNRYVKRFGWDNAKRYANIYPMRLPGNFINEWQVGGHFAIKESKSRLDNLAMQQYPEPGITHVIEPVTISGKPLAWVQQTTMANGFLDLSSGKSTENTIAYARCWLWSPDNRKIDVTIGSDDACRIWVNETLVWDDPDWQDAVADKDFAEIELNKGWNTMLVKIQNGLRGMGIYFRVMDLDIKQASTPPSHGRW